MGVCFHGETPLFKNSASWKSKQHLHEVFSPREPNFINRYLIGVCLQYVRGYAGLQVKISGKQKRNALAH